PHARGGAEISAVGFRSLKSRGGRPPAGHASCWERAGGSSFWKKLGREAKTSRPNPTVTLLRSRAGFAPVRLPVPLSGGFAVELALCELAEFGVRSVLLLERRCEQLHCVGHFEQRAPGYERAVAGDLVVLDGLCRSDHGG